jgi:hypothetical protein
MRELTRRPAITLDALQPGHPASIQAIRTQLAVAALAAGRLLPADSRAQRDNLRTAVAETLIALAGTSAPRRRT